MAETEGMHGFQGVGLPNVSRRMYRTALCKVLCAATGRPPKVALDHQLSARNRPQPVSPPLIWCEFFWHPLLQNAYHGMPPWPSNRQRLVFCRLR